MARVPRTDRQISEIMRRVKSKDTSGELQLGKVIRERGLAYEVGSSGIPGKPDIVFPSKRLAIFVDGDFWHGNQWRRRGLASLADQFTRTHNQAYWISKIERNVARDFTHTASLLNLGWRVLRLWESDLRSNLDRYIDMVIQAGEESGPDLAFAEVPNLTVAEFFAGIGLVRLALESTGWKVIFASDIDPDKFEMYEANFGGEHFVLDDVHNLHGNDIPSCSLATASFPCNDLSLAGAMAGLNGQRSGAFWGLVRVLEEMGERRPPLILVENVPGFLLSHHGSDFKAAVAALNALGYACDAFVVNALQFTPQSRARLFVVGKLGVPPQPFDWLAPSKTRPKILVDFVRAHERLAWDIRRLPEPPKTSTTLEAILEDLPDDDPAWWSPKRADYFMNQLSERHLAIAKLMISRPYYSYGTAFRRVRHGRSMAELRTDGIAGCLRTPRGGSGRQILFKAGCGRYWVRLLTPRECARLMGVPDSYKITVDLNQALFGFGDAVCVPAIEWISNNYLKPIASEMLRGRVLSKGGLGMGRGYG